MQIVGLYKDQQSIFKLFYVLFESFVLLFLLSKKDLILKISITLILSFNFRYWLIVPELFLLLKLLFIVFVQ